MYNERVSMFDETSELLHFICIGKNIVRFMKED